MIGLFDASALPATMPLVGEFPSFAVAEAHARATYKIACFLIDEDNADSADFITEDMRQFAIQPVEGAK